MEQIQALRFDVQEVGKHVKGSKKRYSWDIALKDKSHSIVLDFSFISGKIKITVDRKILLQNQLPADVSFQYPFTLDGFALNIIQQGETFELRINNKVFSHLYTQQKTNTEFKKYEDEVKDIKVDIHQMNPQGKKLSLNIGAFGGQAGMKKKKQAVGEQGSWNAFAGGSFPSYFADNAEPAKVEKASEPIKRNNLLDDEEETAVANRTNNEFNLLQGERVESKQSSNLFDIINDPSPSQQEPVNNSQEFSNMQEMFNSLSVSNPINASSTTSNEIDFFADEPKSTIVKEEVKPPGKVSPAFDFSQQNSGLAGFGTGFGLEGMGQLNQNPKTFATISGGNGSKAFDLGSLDFTLPAKQEPVNAFSKKPAAQQGSYGPMDQLFTAQPPATTVNQTPNISDFNTMQHLFQTNSFGNPQEFTFTQPTPSAIQQKQFATGQLPPQLPPQFTATQPFQGNADDFSTSMMRMFQSSSPQNPPLSQMSLNVASPVDPLPQKQSVQASSLDMFSSNKPATFATMSGGNFQANFDMSSFGTMQPNAKPSLDLNFFDAKPQQKSTVTPPTADLI